MSRSSAEQEIRDAVVSRLRLLMPSARIVHELNTSGQGSSRIDVAAVSRQAIVAVEIKSKIDKLTRLADQWAAFSRCCHYVAVAAHEKHFREHRHEHQREDVPGDLDLDHPLFFGVWDKRPKAWRFPMPESRDRYNHQPWHFAPERDCLRQPKASAMLEMLWAAELRSECGRHSISAGSRATCGSMIRDMVWMMTGREICEAVCRQLRQRNFAEADAPLLETRAAA